MANTNIATEKDKLTEKFCELFLMKLCLKLSEKLSDEQVGESKKKLEQLLNELNEFYEFLDLSDKENKTELLMKHLSDKLNKIFRKDIPDIDKVINDIWIQHLSDLDIINSQTKIN